MYSGTKVHSRWECTLKSKNNFSFQHLIMPCLVLKWSASSSGAYLVKIRCVVFMLHCTQVMHNPIHFVWLYTCTYRRIVLPSLSTSAGAFSAWTYFSVEVNISVPLYMIYFTWTSLLMPYSAYVYFVGLIFCEFRSVREIIPMNLLKNNRRGILNSAHSREMKLAICEKLDSRNISTIQCIEVIDVIIS